MTFLEIKQVQLKLYADKPFLCSIIHASIQRYKEYLSKKNRQMRLWE